MRLSFLSTERVGRAALALVSILLAAAPLRAASLPATLPPIDQCKGDPSFVKFRSTLTHVVARKEKKALLAMLSPRVTVNFGGGTGTRAFLDQWSFDEPDDPDGIWATLKTLLSLGCARDKAVRIIPSIDAQMEPYYDALNDEVGLILPGAKLYKEAGVEARNPKTTPYTLAPITSRAGDLFMGVKLPDGREGLIDEHLLYEPLGYRLMIEKLRGKWMITAFVAGD
jgi:hypothetical protein